MFATSVLWVRFPFCPPIYLDKSAGSIIFIGMNLCENCNAPITVLYGSGRFCSERCCRGFSTKKNRKLISEKVSRTLKSRRMTFVEKPCEHCDRTFTSLIRKHVRFCSKRCAALSRGLHLVGYDRYKRECQFAFNLADYPGEFDFGLIQEHGWYSPKNRGGNLNGVSRDHIVSVRWGFENNIDPRYIRHPANCQLMLHNDNVSKGKKKSISFQELLCRIEAWDKKYLGSKH